MVRWKKSLCTAYFLWLFGGFCGLHHVYLRRYRHALAWWCLPGEFFVLVASSGKVSRSWIFFLSVHVPSPKGGYFGAGWFRDLWRIPEYVREANNDPQYLRDLSKRMRESSKPPLSVRLHLCTDMLPNVSVIYLSSGCQMVRFIGEVVMGNMFGFLAVVAIPNNDYTGTRLEWLGLVTGPLGTAIGKCLGVISVARDTGAPLPLVRDLAGREHWPPPGLDRPSSARVLPAISTAVLGEEQPPRHFSPRCEIACVHVPSRLPY